MPPRARTRSRYRVSRSRLRQPRRWPWVVALVLLLGLAGGAYYFHGHAKAASSACPAAPAQVTFVLGARANMPAPALPATLKDLLRVSADAEQPIVAYRVDGDPSPAMREIFRTPTKASGPRAREIDTFVGKVVDGMAAIRSKQPEADPLRALWLAARETPMGGTVVLFDSGLQTKAPLDFRAEGMLEADPTDVVTKLDAAHAIPDLDGRRVILMGLGDTIAPQENLTTRMHDNIVAIWKAIVDAGNGTCVQVMPDPPLATSALAGVQYVTPVPIAKPPPPPPPCGEVRLSNGGDVGFTRDSDELRDPAAARTFLRSYADSILAAKQPVRLFGTTARWGPKDGQIAMGARRANVVKDILVELGVPAGWITSQGVGSYSSYYRDDHGPKGPLDPAAAAFNRSVVIRLTCP